MRCVWLLLAAAFSSLSPAVFTEGPCDYGDLDSLRACKEARIVAPPPRRRIVVWGDERPDGWSDVFEPGSDEWEFQGRLYDHQFEQMECRRKLQLLGDPLSGTGLGSRFHTLSVGLLLAAHQNRVAVIQPGYWRYADAERCPTRSHECYFESVTSCKQAQRTSRNHTFSHLQVERDGDHWGFARLVRESVPGRFVYRGWWWAACQTMWFLLRPNAMLQERITEFKREVLVGDGEFISLHVRHGDKALEVGLKPLDDYVFGLNRIRMLTGVRRVLLMTDDQGVVEDTRRFPDYEWMYARDYVRRNSSAWDMLSAGEMNGEEEAVHNLVHMLVMAEGRLFVGSLASNWDRTVVMLICAVRCHSLLLHSVDLWQHSVLSPVAPPEVRAALV